GPAARIWSAFLRQARSPHSRRDETERYPTRPCGWNEKIRSLRNPQKRKHGRSEVFSGCAHKRQWCRSLGPASSLRHRAAAPHLCRSLFARTGQRNPGQRRTFCEALGLIQGTAPGKAWPLREQFTNIVILRTAALVANHITYPSHFCVLRLPRPRNHA